MAHDVDMSLSGTVRVQNISFRKSVFIRYTLNKWKSTERDVSLTLLMIVFTARRYASAVYAVVVRLSLRLSVTVGDLLKR